MAKAKKTAETKGKAKDKSKVKGESKSESKGKLKAESKAAKLSTREDYALTGKGFDLGAYKSLVKPHEEKRHAAGSKYPAAYQGDEIEADGGLGFIRITLPEPKDKAEAEQIVCAALRRSVLIFRGLIAYEKANPQTYVGGHKRRRTPANTVLRAAAIMAESHSLPPVLSPKFFRTWVATMDRATTA